MIPFWKKTGKHSKPQSAQKRRQNAKPAVPRTAQQSIPMQRMFEDGTCRVKPNYYTRTIQYQDINYQLAQQEDKTAIFEEWCSFLNFFDSSIKFELSFVNMATDSTEFEKSIRIPYQKDGFDDVRAEYSQMLRQQLAKGNNGLTKTKFITFGVEGESMAQVKPRLDHIQRLPPIIRSTAAYAPPEVIDGKPPIYPYTPIKSSFEDAGSVEDMMLYTELEAAVHAMIQRLEYSFTFNPSLLTIPKRKQQVAEILKEAETYIWRIKEEMRCA